MVDAPLTLTVLKPEAPQSPVSLTPTLTVIALVGAGFAWIVKLAVPPSVIAEPPVIVISGVAVTTVAK